MSAVEISPAAPGEYPAAGRALFADLPAADRDRRAGRLLALLAAGDADPAGLLVARAGGRVVGAGLVQFHPGNAAAAWPPAAADRGVADALAGAVVGRLRAAGVKQAQVVQPPAERARARPLEAAGFRRVTQLAFLCRPTPGAPPADPGELTFEPVADPDPRFAATLLATYDGTRDCPELNGARSADEVLAGYRASAKGDPAGWTLAVRSGDPVGVVILAAGAHPGVHELSYLGLVPAARGRGLGRELVRFALGAAGGAAADWVTLSVDVRNAPALRLYRAHQFREYDRQDVFLWHPTAA